MKKTLIIGASENKNRYSNLAILKLRSSHHEVIAIGSVCGKVADVLIVDDRPLLENLDTVTLYINPIIQKEYYDYILSLNPKRIIFNPGTENPEFEQLAKAKGIQTLQACTLVLLSINQY
jgi:predicted CoA-binding protein